VDQLRYIIDLFDDADPGVVAAVDKYFLENGPVALSRLRSVCKGELDPVKGAIAGKMLVRYNKMLALRDLRSIAGSAAKGQECPLLEAGYLVGSLSDAALSREEYMEMMVPPVMAVMAEISESRTAVENVSLLNHVFYSQYGFSVSSPFDMTLDSTLLMKVLASRKGSPFAVSLLYFIIARTAGLPVYPLCFTGGFVPVYMEGDKILFNINVFHRGEIFIESNISKMVASQASALGVNFDVGEALVKKDQSILVMYIEYLQMLYSNAGEKEAQMDMEDAVEALGGKRYLTVESDEDEW
jgi:hypothetical protein